MKTLKTRVPMLTIIFAMSPMFAFAAKNAPATTTGGKILQSIGIFLGGILGGI